MDFNLGNILTNPMGFVSGIWNDLSGNTAMQMNENMFNKQMDWSKEQFNKQIEMANTAHQREIADLKAAGINPILTAMGGNGAPSAASAAIPSAPDMTASQKGIQGIISTLMTIAPQIAELKNANAAMTQARTAENLGAAQSTKLLAEAGKIGTEHEIAQLTKLMESYKFKHYPDIIESQISKSPLWIVNKIKDMFNYGTNTSAAKYFENMGGKIKSLDEKLYKFENITKEKGKELTGKFIIKMLENLL